MDQTKLKIFQDFLYNKGRNPFIESLVTKKKILLIGPAPYLEKDDYDLSLDEYDIIVRLKSGYPVPSEISEKIGSRTDFYYTNFKSNQNNLSTETYLRMYSDKIKAIVFPYPSEWNITLPITHDQRKLLELLKKNYQGSSSKFNIITNYLKETCLPIPIITDPNPMYFLNLIKLIGTRPTTGVLAILDLLQYPISELKIVGFTFRMELLHQQKTFTPPKDEELTRLYSEYYKDSESRSRSWNKTVADMTHNLEKEFEFFKLIKSFDPRLKIDSVLESFIKKL